MRRTITTREFAIPLRSVLSRRNRVTDRIWITCGKGAAYHACWRMRGCAAGVVDNIAEMIFEDNAVMNTNEDSLYSHQMDRRHFMAGALGLTMSAAATGSIAAASSQTAGSGAAPRRVDFHHHFVPPRHLEAILAQRESGRTPPWSPAMSIAEMDKNGIATAIVSLVQPGIWLGGMENSRRLARECNDYGAKMVADHRGRFGLFAAIPLPDPQGSLREIEYAMDTLKADGIGLMTSFDDKYLGDKAFEPVYEELNRRQTIVYVHPTQPKCCTGLVPGVTVSTIEYATDSTRTIASVMFSGTAAKFPNIRSGRHPKLSRASQNTRSLPTISAVSSIVKTRNASFRV